MLHGSVGDDPPDGSRPDGPSWRARLGQNSVLSRGTQGLLSGWRQAVYALAGGQNGSEGGVRQPRAEAWSMRVWVARATIGRASSAR